MSSLLSSRTPTPTASASSQICCVCRHGRSNVLIYPCQHIAHARCIFPWPLALCPVCQEDVYAVKCLPIQEFSFCGETCEVSSSSKVFGNMLLHHEPGSFSSSSSSASSSSAEELSYIRLVSQAFESGRIPVEETCSISSLLCSLLQCSEHHLQSKIRPRSQQSSTFRGNKTVSTCEELVQYLQLQQSISAAEDALLAKIVSADDLEAASVVCYHMQYTWTRQFVLSSGGLMHHPAVEVTLFSNLKKFTIVEHIAGDIIADRMDIADFNNVSFAELTDIVDTRSFQVFNDLLRCIFRPTHVPHGIADSTQAKAPLSIEDVLARSAVFMEQSPFDLGLVYNVHNRQMTSSTYSLQRVISSNITSVQVLDQLAMLFDDSEPLFNALATVSRSPQDRVHPHYHEEGVELLPQFQSASIQCIASRRVVPNLTVCNGFIHAIAVISVLFVCPAHASLNGNMENIMAIAILNFQPIAPDIYIVDNKQPTLNTIDAVDDDEMMEANNVDGVAAMPADVPSIYKRTLIEDREAGSLIHTLNKEVPKPQQGDAADSSSSKRKNRTRREILDCLRHTVPDEITLISAVQSVVPAQQRSSSSSSMGAVNISIMSELYPVQDRGNTNDAAMNGANSDDSVGSGVTDSEHDDNGCLLFSPSSAGNYYVVSNNNNSYNDAYYGTGGNGEAAYGPILVPSPRATNLVPDPFTRKLRHYLNRLTCFDAIELWVPVETTHSSTNSTSRIMLFGGFASKDELLQGWSVYSRSFVFEEEIGIPGRLGVGGTDNVEHYSDLTTLTESAFLRLEGARAFQLHASLALPVSVKSNAITGDSSGNNSNGRKQSNVVAILYSKRTFPVSQDMIADTTFALKGMKISSQVNQCDFVEDI
jgi:hypothetical protein